MGNCFNFEVDEPPEEDVETRRERMAEAADRRLKEQESRGIKHPERLKAKQAKREEIEKKAEHSGQSGTSLKWNVG